MSASLTLGLSAAATVPASAGPAVPTVVAARSGPAGGALSVSDKTITAGDAVEFKGWLVRGAMNQKALLQVWRNGNWRKVAYDYTNRRGQFSIKIDLDYPAGSYRFRVLGKPSRLYEVPLVITPKTRVAVSPRPGSMEAPWRPGQWFSIADWRFGFNPTITDAWPLKQSQSPSADPPPPGWAYVAVAFGYQRTGSGSGHPYVDNELRFVGSDGVVYTGYATVGGKDYYCSLDDDWLYAPEVYTGGSASGSECVVVQQAAIGGGMWRLSNYDAEFDQFITLS